MDPIKEILKTTVNSNSKYIPTVNSINSLTVETVEDKINSVLEEAQIEPEGVAQMIAEGLGDEKSLAFYKLLVKEHGPAQLLEILHYVQDVARDKTIRYKPAYFMAILKRRGLKTKFKKAYE